MDPPGRFLAKVENNNSEDDAKWQVVDDKTALKKVSQCLRERILQNSDNPGDDASTDNSTVAQKRALLNEEENATKKRKIDLASSVGTQRIPFPTAGVDCDLDRIQHILRTSNMNAQQEVSNQKIPAHVEALLRERSKAENDSERIMQASKISAQREALFRELYSRSTGANRLNLLDQNLAGLSQNKSKGMVLPTNAHMLPENELKRLAFFGAPGLPENELQRLAFLSAPGIASRQKALQEAFFANRMNPMDNSLGWQSLVAGEQLRKEIAAQQLRNRLLFSS